MANYKCTYAGDGDDGVHVTNPRGTGGIRFEFVVGAKGIIKSTPERAQGVVYLTPEKARKLADELYELAEVVPSWLSAD